MTLNLTNAGLNVLLRALAGDKIIFTKVQIGNGAPQTAATAETLSNPLLDLPVQAIEVGATNATLQTKFNNSSVEAGFRHTETGIWVQNQDDDTQEVLYAYGTQPDATADYIASSGDHILETQLDFLVFIGEATDISAIISESLVYASAAELKAHVDDKNNPHNVTKEQVGLGRVPNVATNDQTPTYTAAASLSQLTSGEKLSTALGKIAKAVSNLIAHVGNKGNPHEVTAEQAGAASKTHSHSATDIKSGTLGIARGGTGKTSWLANRLFYATTAAAIGQMPFPTVDGMALRQDKSGAPYWGVTSTTGTYTGQGRTGSSAKNSITFPDGCPKMVIIKERSAGRWGILLIHASASTGWSVVDGVTSNLVVSVSENTVSWYYNSQDSHPANQLDVNNQIYTYAGIY